MSSMYWAFTAMRGPLHTRGVWPINLALKCGATRSLSPILLATRLNNLPAYNRENAVTDEAHNMLAAKLVAHERILGLLLAPIVKALSQADRDALVDTLCEPDGHPDYGPGTDIGGSNDIPLLEKHHRVEVERVFKLALLEDYDGERIVL